MLLELGYLCWTQVHVKVSDWLTRQIYEKFHTGASDKRKSSSNIVHNILASSELFRYALCYCAVFGMNVGGVPWTIQKSPDIKDGFQNVLLLCLFTLVVVLLCFFFASLYTRINAWRNRKSLQRNWSMNRKSFLRRTSGAVHQEKEGYLRIWKVRF